MYKYKNYRIAGNFRVVQMLTIFEGKAVNAKLKLGETPTHRYFTCKACGGCGFLALKREYYNCENSICTVYNHTFLSFVVLLSFIIFLRILGGVNIKCFIIIDTHITSTEAPCYTIVPLPAWDFPPHYTTGCTFLPLPAWDFPPHYTTGCTFLPLPAWDFPPHYTTGCTFLPLPAWDFPPRLSTDALDTLRSLETV